MLPGPREDPMTNPSRSHTQPLRIPRALTLLLFLVCALAQGCTCTHDQTASPTGIAPCLRRKPSAPVAPGAAPGVKTVAAGTVAGSFSVTSAGDATYSIPLVAIPGRAGMEPRLAVTFDGSGDGILGQGVSLAGVSVI